MTPPGPPLRVRALRAVLRRIPRGRYRLFAAAPARGRFVASLAPDAGGARFHCDLADGLSREVCLTGLYEPPVSRIVQRHVSAGATVVDAGANWGYFSLLAARAAGPTGRVLALEPDPRHFEALAENVRLNGFAWVVPVAAAAAAAEGRALLQGYDEANANRGVSRVIAAVEPDARGFEVRCAAIDDLTAANDRVDLVKIDVEGAEDAVLEGMRRGLAARRYRVIVLELHPDLLRGRGVDPEACLRLLAGYGYEGRTIDVSPGAYRRALNASIDVESLLLPLDRWRGTRWPHLLWRC